MRCVWPMYYMTVAVVLVAALHIKICYAIPTGSSRLNTSLEGSVLTWWLWGGQDQGSDPIHYSVAVYTSLAPNSEIFLASERTTDTTFDLDTLELKDGTYYLQVQAFIDMENTIYGEIIIYNATTDGKNSQSTSLTMLLTVILCVFAAAIAVGSCLFALTMWRIRARGRRHSRGQSTSRTCTCCMCLCRLSGRRGTARDGLHLSTIEARDKNKQWLPLHLANRDVNAHRLNKHGGASQPSRAKERSDDLPYGYVSPADINIPQFRNKSRLTSSESAPQPSKPANLPNQSTDTESEGGARQSVSDTTASRPDSIYSIPCSSSPIIEEYDDTQNYLTILPR